MAKRKRRKKLSSYLFTTNTEKNSLLLSSCCKRNWYSRIIDYKRQGSCHIHYENNLLISTKYRNQKYHHYSLCLSSSSSCSFSCSSFLKVSQVVKRMALSKHKSHLLTTYKPREANVNSHYNIDYLHELFHILSLYLCKPYNACSLQIEKSILQKTYVLRSL